MALDPYAKTPWVNDSAPAIDSDNLNNIERGIFDVTEATRFLELNPPAPYVLPPATNVVLGGIKFSVTTDSNGVVTGSIYTT